MRAETVRKRCDTCSHVVRVSRDKRTCQQLERNSKGFKTGWRCPGKLVTIVRRRRTPATEVPIPEGRGLGYVLSAEYQQQVLQKRGDRWREQALKKLARAEAHWKQAEQDSKAAEKRMRRWTAEMRKQQARAAMLDDEVEAVRQRALKAGQVSTVKRRLSKAAGTKEQQA